MTFYFSFFFGNTHSQHKNMLHSAILATLSADRVHRHHLREREEDRNEKKKILALADWPTMWREPCWVYAAVHEFYKWNDIIIL